ncbi:MAG TPA: DegT/DnrJ/EryC1/StrS family aminotransferase [Candidatus Thermoplasmatota archaeon]|nr:DegT/DnrJ/EryC1/StrS family aminotransferase [Candidatus Thermoplasmatota archaeon]
MNPIPIAKPSLGPEEQKAVAEVLASGMIASGPKVAAFEEAFARYVGARHAVATSNGTTALHAALLALGVGPGDEVILPNFTFVATANTVLFAGATPVLVDVEPATFTLDPAAVEAAITPRTKAIMPVHLYGHPARMDKLRGVAARHGLRILGDAAQAHGAAYKGRRVGVLADAECFSFYPTKNMTTAEGGLVTTDDAAVAERVRSLVNHGRAKSELGTYDHVALGHNFRLTDVHAAIGLVQLGKLEAWNERRRQNAKRLAEGLRGAVTVPVEAEGCRHVYHQFTVRAGDRDALLARLKAQGVGYGIYYPKTLTSYPHLAPLARHKTPEADRAVREVVSLPVHPMLSDEDVERVIRATRG